MEMDKSLYRELSEKELFDLEQKLRLFTLSEILRDRLGGISYIEIYHKEYDPIISVNFYDLNEKKVYIKGLLSDILPLYEWEYLYNYLKVKTTLPKMVAWSKDMYVEKPVIYCKLC